MQEINGRDPLSCIADVAQRARTHLGEKERKQEKDVCAALAGDALYTAKGTIKWDGPKGCSFGYEDVWQYIAGTYHPRAQEAKPLQRAEIAQENAHIYKVGFEMLAAKLLERDGITLMKVPALVKNRMVSCITVYPDTAVNELGETAREIWTAREHRRVKGQAKASFPRLKAVEGVAPAKMSLLEDVASVVQVRLNLQD